MFVYFVCMFSIFKFTDAPRRFLYFVPILARSVGDTNHTWSIFPGGKRIFSYTWFNLLYIMNRCGMWSPNRQFKLLLCDAITTPKLWHCRMTIADGFELRAATLRAADLTKPALHRVFVRIFACSRVCVFCQQVQPYQKNIEMTESEIEKPKMDLWMLIN